MCKGTGACPRRCAAPGCLAMVYGPASLACKRWRRLVCPLLLYLGLAVKPVAAQQTPTKQPAISALATTAAPAEPTAAMPQPGAQEELRLEALLAEVAQHNPRLHGLRAQLRAAGERPAQVRTLEDPVLMAELWQVPWDRASVPLMFTLRQALPWPGKLRARAAVLEKDVDRARAESAMLAVELRRQASRAYYEYRLAVRSREVLGQLRELLQAEVAAVEARYRVGRVELTELLTAQEAVISLANLLLDAERERDLAATTINLLRGASPDAPLGMPVSPPPARKPPESAWLIQRALAQRPELLTAAATAAQAQARGRAAQRERFPDLAVWTSVMKDLKGTQDTFTVGLQTSLPSFSLARNSAAAREARYQGQAAQAEQQAAELLVRSDIRQALLRLETTLRHLELHSGSLIPLAEQAARAAQAGFQSGRVPLSSLLATQHTLSEHHLEYERFLAECGQRWADLEAAVGAPLLGTEENRSGSPSAAAGGVGGAP